MATDPWEQATFTGTAEAQLVRLARLTTDQRLALLEQLLELAESSGALQRSRAEKQAAIDRFWTEKADVSSDKGHAGGTPAF